jgi:tRNA-dihydrouridine synthase
MPDLPKPFFVLAPMDDVTDTVFRQIVQSCAPADLYVTEFVNVDGLQSAGRAKLLPKLQFAASEGPLIAQLWGKNPDNFYKTARQIADGSLARELGLPEGVNFVGVDLNMGCPAKSEVQNGTCSALILPMNRELASQIIDACREGLASALANSDHLSSHSKDMDVSSDPLGAQSSDSYTPPQVSSAETPRSHRAKPDTGQSRGVQMLGTSLPLSVKTRLGYHEVDYSWHEFLLNKKLNMLTIHGRTKKQMSKVPAEWDKIEKVRELRDRLSPTTLVVGNGDVMNREQGVELAKKHGLDGIMIGRGVFQDPFVMVADSPWESISKEDRIKLYQRHVELFAKTWTNNERRLITLNKFCKVYINGFDGAKEMREKLMVCDTADQLLALLETAQ